MLWPHAGAPASYLQEEVETYAKIKLRYLGISFPLLPEEEHLLTEVS